MIHYVIIRKHGYDLCGIDFARKIRLCKKINSNKYKNNILCFQEKSIALIMIFLHPGHIILSVFDPPLISGNTFIHSK